MFGKVGTKVALIVNAALLLVIVAGSLFLIQRQSTSLEDQLLERGRIESIVGAKLIGSIIDEAVDNGVFTVKDAFDMDYQLIPGFDPPKYHTRIDAYMDKAILALQDEFLKDESVVYAVAVDTNGYLPTHNTRYQQPITGDQKKDLVGNRTKRIFNDAIGLKSAQNKLEAFQQIYHRDTGETMWDVSSPIYVKGKQWGNFRLGFSLNKINAAQTQLTMFLIGLMGTILVISLLLVFFLVSRSLKPLVEFTRIASDLADGKVDEEIKVTSRDEIGQLANVLERLRVSLKVAMDRIRRQRGQ